MVSSIEAILISEGYTHLRFIPGRGWCGIERMIFTVGLFYGLTEHSREGRYCYDCLTEAKAALSEWNGEGDPPGPWIKHKGKHGERGNTNSHD